VTAAAYCAGVTALTFEGVPFRFAASWQTAESMALIPGVLELVTEDAQVVPEGSCVRRGVEEGRVARGADTGEVAEELVEREEEEELVAKNRTANSDSHLLAPILRLEDLAREADRVGLGLDGMGREGILCAPASVPIVEVRLSVDLICAALGNGVDDAARGATILNGVVRGVDLKLLDGRLRSGIANASAAALLGEEGLVVVGPIEGDVIKKCAFDLPPFSQPFITGVFSG